MAPYPVKPYAFPVGTVIPGEGTVTATPGPYTVVIDGRVSVPTSLLLRHLPVQTEHSASGPGQSTTGTHTRSKD
jgi:hypothetical protein